MCTCRTRYARLFCQYLDFCGEMESRSNSWRINCGCVWVWRREIKRQPIFNVKKRNSSMDNFSFIFPYPVTLFPEQGAHAHSSSHTFSSILTVCLVRGCGLTLPRARKLEVRISWGFSVLEMLKKNILRRHRPPHVKDNPTFHAIGYPQMIT